MQLAPASFIDVIPGLSASATGAPVSGLEAHSGQNLAVNPEGWVLAWLSQTEQIDTPNPELTRTNLPVSVRDSFIRALQAHMPEIDTAAGITVQATLRTDGPAQESCEIEIEEPVEDAEPMIHAIPLAIPLVVPVQTVPQPIVCAEAASEHSPLAMSEQPRDTGVPVAAETKAVAPSPIPTDRGEIIWEQPFQVTARTQETTSTPTETALEGGVEPAKQLTVTPVKATGREFLSQEQQDAAPNQDPEQPPADRPLSPEQKTKDAPASQGAEPRAPNPPPTQPVRRPESKERTSGGLEAPAGPAPTPGQHRTQVMESSNVATSAQPVSAVEETATPLRPTQIATIQIDVAPAGPNSADSPAMRLVVSQRGDQVNVRLRSFDAATAPIDPAQMQPLIDSLSEKGMVATQQLRPAETSFEHSVTSLADVRSEKTQAIADASLASSDQQNPLSSGQDERQQHQQERHQQRQEQAMLRRQLRQPANPAAFELFASSETANSQQGGLR